MDTEQPVTCRMCGREIEPDMARYVVEIKVYAAADPPDGNVYLCSEGDFESNLKSILEEISASAPRELEDQVYKFVKFNLCRPCRQRFLNHPLIKSS